MTRVFDLVIRNAQLALGDGLSSGSIAVQDGRIAAIGDGFDGAEVIDAKGLWALPGGIDSHCHIDQPGDEARGMDSWASASRAALCGGTTTVLPFAMPEPGQSGPLDAVARALARSKGASVVDYGLHAVLLPGLDADLPALFAGLTGMGVSSIKLFLTYDGYAVPDPDILRIMDLAAQSGIAVMLHAESDLIIGYMAERLRAAGKTGLEWHPVLHHPAAEQDATCRMAAYAEVTGAEIVVLHVSSERALGEITAAAGRDVRVLAETCPQYLFGQDAPPEHRLFSPPARGDADRRALWQALARGDIALWSSDHSPSMRAAKYGQDVFTATSGVPGLETRLPLLFSEGLLAGRISLPRYLDLAGAAAARRFGLGASKGRIAPGYDADLVLWDPGHRWTIDPGQQQSRTDYCPYAGMQLTGKPVTALLRGQTVLQGGEIAQPTGRYLPRDSAKPTHSVLKDPAA